MADAEVVAKHFNPFAVLLVQCFAWNVVDLNVGVESHVFFSLAIESIGYCCPVTRLMCRA
ncbi:hypothetical protein D3C78_1786980 [compost metagenome]